MLSKHQLARWLALKGHDGFKCDLAIVFGLLEDGVLRPGIDLLPLDQAAEAHRRLEAGEVLDKLVLSVD